MVFIRARQPGRTQGIFDVNVTGALKSGVVLFGMVRENRVWSIQSAQLLEADGQDRCTLRDRHALTEVWRKEAAR